MKKRPQRQRKGPGRGPAQAGQSDRLKAMKAARRPREIELSIGKMIVKLVDIEDLVMSGRIPMTTVDEIKAIRRTPAGGFELGDAVKFLAVINAVVMAGAVDPRVTPQATDESMGLEDLSYDDKQAIFVECSRTAWEHLNSFSLLLPDER